MSRVSVGWVMARRSAVAAIFPVSATARKRTRSVRLSNMATFPGAGAAGRMFLLDYMWGRGPGIQTHLAVRRSPGRVVHRRFPVRMRHRGGAHGGAAALGPVQECARGAIAAGMAGLPAPPEVSPG